MLSEIKMYRKKPDSYEAVWFDGTNVAQCSALLDRYEIPFVLNDMNPRPFKMIIMNLGEDLLLMDNMYLVVHANTGRVFVYTDKEFSMMFEEV